jgi:hypothetical protein
MWRDVEGNGTDQALLAARAAESVLAAAQVVVSATLALPKPALAMDKQRLEDKDDNDIVLRIEAYAAPFFACIDAVMAKIRAMDDSFGDWAAFGNKLLAKENNDASALTMPPSAPPTALLPPPHRPTMYKDAVISTMGGSLRAKSLVVAPLSRPSPTVDGQLQMACCRSQPRCRVCHRHCPRAPNTQEHLLCGRRHWSCAPNQSTVNGWA